MSTAGSRPRRATDVVIALCAIACLASCGHSNVRTTIGSVSTTSPNLCVARPAAKGLCLNTGSVDVSSLRAGECVKATYRTPGTQGADGELTKVQSASGC
jgi:hypothetical protein